MTRSRSSSNRAASPGSAVVIQDNRIAGPIRLPPHRADDFVAHFNRVYRGLEMSLLVVSAPDPDEKNPRQSED